MSARDIAYGINCAPCSPIGTRRQKEEDMRGQPHLQSGRKRSFQDERAAETYFIAAGCDSVR